MRAPPVKHVSELTRMREQLNALELSQRDALELERESQHVFEHLRHENARLKKAVGLLSSVVDKETRAVRADAAALRNDLAADAASLRSELAGVRAACEAQLAGVRAECDAQLASARAECDARRAETDEVRAELGALRSANGELRAAHSGLCSTLNELRAEHVELRRSHDKMVTTNAEIRTEWVEARASHAETRAEWKAIRESHSWAAAPSWHATQEASELRNELRNEQHELRSELRNEQHVLHGEHTNLKHELHTLGTELKSELSSIRSESDALKTQWGEARAAHGELRNELRVELLAAKEAAKVAASDVLEATRRDLDEARSRVTGLRGNVEAVARTVGEVKQRQRNDAEAAEAAVSSVSEGIHRLGLEVKDMGKAHSAALTRASSTTEADILKLQQRVDWITERERDSQMLSSPRLESRAGSSSRRQQLQPRLKELPEPLSAVSAVSAVSDSTHRRVDELSSRHHEAHARVVEVSGEVVRHRDAIMLLVETVDSLTRDTKRQYESIGARVAELAEDSDKRDGGQERALAGLRAESAALRASTLQLEKQVGEHSQSLHRLQQGATSQSEWAANMAKEHEQMRSESVRISAAMRSLKVTSRETMDAVAAQKSQLRVALDEIGLRRVSDANSILRRVSDVYSPTV